MATSRPSQSPNNLPPGRAVQFKAKDGKERPGVVLRVQGEILLVIAGTGTAPREGQDDPAVRVEANHRYGKALRLTKTTWYRRSNIQYVPVESVVRTIVQVPPGLLLDLEALIPSE